MKNHVELCLALPLRIEAVLSATCIEEMVVGCKLIFFVCGYTSRQKVKPEGKVGTTSRAQRTR